MLIRSSSIVSNHYFSLPSIITVPMLAEPASPIFPAAVIVPLITPHLTRGLNFQHEMKLDSELAFQSPSGDHLKTQDRKGILIAYAILIALLSLIYKTFKFRIQLVKLLFCNHKNMS